MQVAAGGENADGRLAEPRNGLTTAECTGLRDGVAIALRQPSTDPAEGSSRARFWKTNRRIRLITIISPPSSMVPNPSGSHLVGATLAGHGEARMRGP